METGSSKEISGLKALIPMICAIIGDTQDTGKQEEALRKRRFIDTFSTPGVSERQEEPSH